MAILQKLRDKGKLVAIIIGLALLLFILGDMLRSGRALWGNKRFYIAEVNGKPIMYQDYQRAIDEAVDYYKTMRGQQGVDDQTMISIRTQVWQQLITSKLLEQLTEKDGVVVTPDELYDMVLGDHPSPIVMQIFVNPKTGRFDRNFARQVLMNLNRDPKLEKFWIYIEKNLKIQRLSEKYSNLLSKAMMATTNDAKENYYERSKIYDLDIAYYPYKKISDSLIDVTNSEINDYYEKYKEHFYQSVETRQIMYITFNVKPSHDDSTKVLDKITQLKSEFEKTQDPVEYVNINGDEQFQDRYYTKKDLTPPLDSLFFVAPIGTVYGPYIENGYYVVARLLDRQVRPDTVSFRHILISPSDPKVKTLDRAKEIADSLMQQIKKGVKFEAVVSAYSDDKASIPNGGKYENVTEGQMVPEINDFVFTHKVGYMDTVTSQYGVHIVEITDQRSFEPKVKIAFLKLQILPSQKTYDQVYREAALFRSSIKQPGDFEKLARQKGYFPRIASNLTKGTFTIPGLTSPRDIVHWAYKAKLGEVSNVFDLGETYVVAKLIRIRPKGYAPLDQVKEYIRQVLLNQKKGDYILNLIKQKNIPTNSIDAFAKAVGQPATKATNVPFSSYAINGIGYEPAIFGALDVLKLNHVFGPIKGKGAVYLLQATSITVPPEPTQAELLPTQKSLTQGLRGMINSELFTMMMRDYKVDDYRTRFF